MLDPAAVHRSVRDRVVASGEVPDSTDIAVLVASEAPLLAPAEVDIITGEVLAELTGLGRLEPLLADDAVTDVLVNGPGAVWVERDGRLMATNVVLDERAIYRSIERIVGPLGLRCDPASPIVDARLADGSRVAAVVPPLAIDGPCLAIRRFRTRTLPVEAFAEPATATMLRGAVASRRNLIVSGGTGAGKTTLLNSLSAAIDHGERLVTIEEAAELRLAHPHVIRLEARPPNAEGVGEVGVRQLVRAALRLRPDRVIVGECRGAETIDMLQAMNTGHAGSMSTCHANSPDDALRRLETMVLLGDGAVPLVAVREQLCAALDLIVQVGRDRDGGRRVLAVAEVVGGGALTARTRRVA